MKTKKRNKIKKDTARLCREGAAVNFDICSKIDTLINHYKEQRRRHYKLARLQKALARYLESKKDHKYIIRTIIRDIEEVKRKISV